MLFQQGKCRECRGSGHRDSDQYCLLTNRKAGLNVITARAIEKVNNSGLEKNLVFDQDCNQGRQPKEAIICKISTTKRVRISAYVIQDNVPKIKEKYLVFQAGIAEIKTCLLIDNGSEAKLIDKAFVCEQRINIFKLKRKIKLTLGNKKVVQKLDSACLIDVHIGDYHKQILCYVASFDIYTIVLGDDWLQTHNLAINWKDRTIKFNSTTCIESWCLTHSVLYIKFAIGNKTNNRIEIEKLTAIDSDIDIKLVNAKHFFQMARQKDHKG